MSHRHRLTFEGRAFEIGVRRDGSALELHLPDGASPRLEAVVDRPGELVLVRGGTIIAGAAEADRDRVVVSFRGRTWILDRPSAAKAPDSRGAGAARADDAREIEAPMTGTVIDVRCRAGDVVEAGATLLVVSAMKMEHRLAAPARARVLEVLVAAGALVDIGQALARLGPAPEPA